MRAADGRSRARTTSIAGEQYADELVAIMQLAFELERDAMDRGARLLADRFSAGGLLYIFGSGHSHMFAEEAFYRAGGPIQVVPILHPPYMLHEGAVRSTELEREDGHGAEILSAYDLEPEADVLLVVSNSGANALPLEIARLGLDAGVPLLAITSVAYSQSIDRAGPRLCDLADITIDNHCPPGDALVGLAGGGGLRAGPGSSVVGLALLNRLLVSASDLIAAGGGHPAVLHSANLPGAIEHNLALVDRYRDRIPNL